MKATGHSNLFHVLTLSVFLESLTFTQEQKVGDSTSMSPLQLVLSEQNHDKPHQRHRTMTTDQTNDQNLQYMLNLYWQSTHSNGSNKELRELGSNTVRLVRSSASNTQHDSAFTVPWNAHTVEYELKILPREKLVKAALVHSRGLSPRKWPVSCEVTVTSLGSSGEATWGGRVVFKAEDQWTQMDITRHISRHAGQHLSFDIRYRCTEGGWLRRRRRTSGLPSRTTQLRAPALLLYLDDEGAAHWESLPGLHREPVPLRRSRRARHVGSIGSDIPNYQQKSTASKNLCKLHSYRVTFQELGWEHWIIAPHKYNPRYCKGDCPRVLHYGYNSPNHAIVQNFIHELANSEVPPPACVPYKYKPISVLMMEKNGSIVYKEYKDMIAESCTCR
uniref:Bone morphogenetic protein 15 n=1 Tax=Lepisosteus oculatus TaxID=7918 RepID=W5NAJ0_LEPOC|nr:PREDICTED: bone morphogenetic protein 15 [Lepisosteus oculatus]